jgi:hypothetical protein
MHYTDKEALKLALEALQEPLGFTGSREIDAKLREAIKALRQTLAAPTVQEPTAYCDPSDPFSSTAFSWPGTEHNPSHTQRLYTAQHAAPVQQAIDHSCKNTYELIMKWADIYAAQTGNIYSEAARDPSKAARMADERTILADIAKTVLATPPAAQPAPVPLTEMAKILVDRLAEEQAVYLSMETAKSFVESMLAAAPEKGQP